MSKDYNGWTNKQTWNINMLYQESFEAMVQEQPFDDVDHVADAFESLVDELEYEGLMENSLAHTAVGEYLDRVNWVEIAEHYYEAPEAEEEAEEDLEAEEMELN